jgi:hypothetical protein
MISHVHAKGEWMVSYRYMRMEMAGLLNGTEKVDDQAVFQDYLMSSSHMRMDMHMLMAMYGISNRFTVMAMGNYNVNSMDMSMLPTTGMAMSHMQGMDMGDSKGMDMSMHTSGIGDTKLTLLYGLIRQNYHHILLSGGLSIPTGSIQQKGGAGSMYPNTRLPYAMQLGSGTWDLLPGLTYWHQKGKFSWSSQVTGVIRTGYNSIGYQLGNQITSNTWVAYQWFPFVSSSLRMEGTVSERIYGQDPSVYAYMEPSANPMNYGGTYLNAFAGINVYLRKGILAHNKLSIEAGFPMYQKLNGPQMATQFTLFATWTFAI